MSYRLDSKQPLCADCQHGITGVGALVRKPAHVLWCLRVLRTARWKLKVAQTLIDWLTRQQNHEGHNEKYYEFGSKMKCFVSSLKSLFFSYSFHSLLFCLIGSVRCAAWWLDGRLLYRVMSPVLPVPTWHHPYHYIIIDYISQAMLYVPLTTL